MNRVVCFGEILWDIYTDDKKAGGAPFNVAAQLSNLGCDVSLISKVGSDALGKELIEYAEAMNVRTNLVQTDEYYPTGTVQIQLDQQGSPTYDISFPSSWDFIGITTSGISVIEQSDALVYGTLAARADNNFKTLQKFIESSKLNILDLNLRLNYFSNERIIYLLEKSHVLKINQDEFIYLMDLCELNSDNFFKKLSDIYNIPLIIKTNGSYGAEAYHDGSLYTVDAPDVQVIDTVGAGDAFLAATIDSYLKGKSIVECLTNGVELGAYVTTKKGAIPQLELKEI